MTGLPGKLVWCVSGSASFLTVTKASTAGLPPVQGLNVGSSHAFDAAYASLVAAEFVVNIPNTADSPHFKGVITVYPSSKTMEHTSADERIASSAILHTTSAELLTRTLSSLYTPSATV